MLDGHKAINFSRQIITIVKKTLKKIETSYSLYRALKILKALKKPRKKQKLRSI